VALVRSDRRHNELKALGAEARLLDIENSDTAGFAAALGDTDAIVFAAGGGPDGNIERKSTVDLEGSLKAAQGPVVREPLGHRQIGRPRARQLVFHGGHLCGSLYREPLRVQLEAEFKSRSATAGDAKDAATIGHRQAFQCPNRRERPQIADIEPIGFGRGNPLNCRVFAAAREIRLHD
jgi:hypothetical protein